MKRSCKVLIVGGTGRLGKRLVKACLAQGYPTYVLCRWRHDKASSPAAADDHQEEDDYAELKLEAYKELERQFGVHLVYGSFSDHKSLVDCVKLVDVVICAITYLNKSILLQLKLVDAIKEAGNVKRFLPAEFGMDTARMGNALPPGRDSFDEKMAVRKAIEDAGIPHTYVVGNCFASIFVGGLSQLKRYTPSRDHVFLCGDGNVDAIYVDEDDIATYTIKTIEDPRTLNKTLHIRPWHNIISQRGLVEIWEKLIGKSLQKTCISSQEFLAGIKDESYDVQVAACHFHDMFFEGCLTNFEIGDEGEELALKLYPEVRYTRVEEYLMRYL